MGIGGNASDSKNQKERARIKKMVRHPMETESQFHKRFFYFYTATHTATHTAQHTATRTATPWRPKVKSQWHKRCVCVCVYVCVCVCVRVCVCCMRWGQISRDSKDADTPGDIHTKTHTRPEIFSVCVWVCVICDESKYHETQKKHVRLEKSARDCILQVAFSFFPNIFQRFIQHAHLVNM